MRRLTSQFTRARAQRAGRSGSLAHDVRVARPARAWAFSLVLFSNQLFAQVESDRTPPEQELAEQSIGSPALVPNLIDRLEALSPHRPRAYFELGEEVLAEARTRRQRELAVRLFALAFELERRQSQLADRPPDAVLMSSCCLALAPLAETQGDRRWLRSLAAAVGELAPAPTPTENSSSQEGGAADANALLDAATVLGLARSGQGIKAAKLLAKPGIEAVLLKHERLLSPTFTSGGLADLHSMIDQHRGCSTCRGKHVVKDASGIHICPRCQGRVGPKLSDQDLVLHLRTEAALLTGSQRSWSAASMVDAGAPVRDADPAQLVVTLNVDADFPIYRNGAWVRDITAQPAMNTPTERARDGDSKPEPDAP